LASPVRTSSSRAGYVGFRKRTEEECMVLVRPVSRRVQKKRLALTVIRVEEIVIDAMRHNVDARAIEIEASDRTLANKGTRNDHPSARRAARS